MGRASTARATCAAAAAAARQRFHRARCAKRCTHLALRRLVTARQESGEEVRRPLRLSAVTRQCRFQPPPPPASGAWQQT